MLAVIECKNEGMTLYEALY